jgi:EmrB/QacA subfamily drug resistance transporter
MSLLPLSAPPEFVERGQIVTPTVDCQGATITQVQRGARAVAITWQVIDGPRAAWDRAPMTTFPLNRRLGGRLGASRWAPLPIVLAGTFMVVLDFFIVNVALPSIQTSLHASSGAIEWVAAGYGLTAAVFLITSGRLGDRFGRRRVFSLGLALFTAASAACGAAPNSELLIVARLVQGFAAALVMPNVLSIIGVTYTGPDRPRALSAYAMVMGAAAVFGQLIGGVLVQADVAGLGWRSCFLINVPVGLLALALAPRMVPESRAERASRIDGVGTALITAGLTAIVLPLVEGRQHGWPLWTWVSLAVAPVVLGCFVVHQRRLAGNGGAPLLHPSLFVHRTFSAGLVAQTVFWCGQASFFLVLALYLQQGRGLSALHAGLVFTILAVSYLAASVSAPALTERHGRRVLAAGAVVLATGHALLLATVAYVGVGGSVALLAPGLLLIGAGMGLGIAPLTTIVLSDMRPDQVGAASGAISTAQQVGNALGVAIIGVIFFGALNHGFADAFEWSLAALAAILVSVAALSRLLPAPARRSDADAAARRSEADAAARRSDADAAARGETGRLTPAAEVS